MDRELMGISDEMKGVMGALNTFTKEAKADLQSMNGRMRAVEQALARRPGGTGPAQQTLGYQVANSDELKRFIAGGSRGVVRVNAAVTSAPDSGGALVAPDRRTEIVELARRALRVRSVIPATPTSSNLIEYPRQTARTISPEFISEQTQKPVGDIDFELAESAVRTIAAVLPASKQIIDDAPQLMSFIDTEMRWAVDQAEESQILLGDGVGQNLHGVIPQATAYAAPFAIPGATMIDTILLAIAQAEGNELPVDAVMLHMLDWRRIQTLKDAENRYLGAGPFAVPGNFIWGVPVVPTNTVPVDEFLLGAFGQAVQIFDRQETTVEISTENKDDFEKNMITIRAEKRVALAVKRPASLVSGDFGNVT